MIDFGFESRGWGDFKTGLTRQFNRLRLGAGGLTNVRLQGAQQFERECPTKLIDLFGVDGNTSVWTWLRLYSMLFYRALKNLLVIE